MINVLIAEDELLIRMGLESSIPWNELGFNIVAIVSDGQKAWDAYQRYQPDILITDIRMPKLDGIELIKKIRQEDSKCKIIIITCIEYFDTLYQSIDQNIIGYLLKASMTHNNLYQLLSQAKREIDSSEPPSSVNTIADVSINDRFRMYLIDRSISLDEFIAGIPGFHINSIEQCYLLTVYCGFVNKALFQSITATIKEELSSFGTLLVTCTDDKIYLFIQSEQEVTFDMISLAMEHLCEYMKNFFSLSLRYTFAPVEKFGNLPTIVDISNHFIDRPYFFPCHCIYANGKQPYNVPFSMIESIRHNPSCYAFFDGKVAEHFFALCDALSANYGTDKLSFTASLSELTVFISDFCFSPEKKESLDNFVPSSFDNAPDALKELLEIVPKFAPNPLYNSDMLKTIQYIHQNYMEAISISKLASMLNVSSNYYAILFRKLTNTNFTDFLTGIRLYHARQMLCETSFPISQIADRCGFSDAAYFAKFFKQNYGMTPRQYRALKKGESQ